jgi:hypothetical protein
MDLFEFMVCYHTAETAVSEQLSDENITFAAKKSYRKTACFLLNFLVKVPTPTDPPGRAFPIRRNCRAD